jgi:aryl-alcohol dehydrogenase-like predicted oxidoreductase
MALETRRLGGLSVPALGLGCMGMSQSYGPADEAESIATVHRALDLGCTFLDTAEVYGPHHNEELLGRALKGRRHEAIIATKFGFRIVDGKRAGLTSRPEDIRKAVEGALKRLATDHIDLYYQHRLDPQTPIEDTAGAVGELVREGKVRFFGLSEVGVATIKKAHAVHPVAAVQSEYSLWERNLEDDVIPALHAMNIGLVPFSPLGRGFLTGAVKRAEEYAEGDFRKGDPRYQGENFDANMKAVRVVRDFAAAHNATPAQVALAWILHKDPSFVPIPGTKRRKYLEENLKAAEINLSAADMKALDGAMGNVSGLRYPPALMATVDR